MGPKGDYNKKNQQNHKTKKTLSVKLEIKSCRLFIAT